MTVQEIEAKKIQLETTLTTALEAAKVLVPATPEFDEAYGRYLSAKSSLAKIPDELSKAKIAQNADAIKAIADSMSEAIVRLVNGWKVEDLLGTKVIALRYAVDAEGKGLVVFNPITQIRSTGKAPKEAKGGGHNFIVGPDNKRWSLTKFVLAFATDVEKATPEFKYPHARADSKPKFEAFCTAHNLTGYTYELAGKAAPETTS